MRVILDSNVIIAAFASRGLCEAVMELCLENHEVVLSKYLLTEVEDKLSRKIKLPKTKIREIKNFLKAHCLEFVLEKLSKELCRDPGDIYLLGLVSVSKADFLVTGDKDLLVLEKFNKVRIINPRQFWDANIKL